MVLIVKPHHYPILLNFKRGSIRQMKLKEKIKRKFCNHSYKVESEYVKTLTPGDKIKYRILVCEKCGKKETHQFYLGNEKEK